MTDKISEIEEYDFFAQDKKDFYSKFSHKSILCQGKHRDKKPLVTILITTYKRPELLRQALLSALNQKGFDDYQIIVVDNEGKPIEEETPTAKFMQEFQDEKVIYYRHSEEVEFRMDSAVRLARSPWIVFLHDDDMLAENHLAIMTDVVKKHKQIKLLGCDMQIFSSEKEITDIQNAEKGGYRLYTYPRDAACFGNSSGWLAALISRKHYIEIGGMPKINTGIGDTIFMANFLHHFGSYTYSGGKPLYFYRKGEQQLSYLYACNSEVKINEYLFYKYVINKYHKWTHKILERNRAYMLFDFFQSYWQDDIYHANIDYEFIISRCGLPSDIMKKGIRYYFTRIFFRMYGLFIRTVAYIYRQKVKKSDIYITI